MITYLFPGIYKMPKCAHGGLFVEKFSHNDLLFGILPDPSTNHEKVYWEDNISITIFVISGDENIHHRCLENKKIGPIEP